MMVTNNFSWRNQEELVHLRLVSVLRSLVATDHTTQQGNCCPPHMLSRIMTTFQCIVSHLIKAQIKLEHDLPGNILDL